VRCEQSQTVLHGYLDGELDAARAAEFERHLETCSDCQAALEAQEALRSAIQKAQLYERAPISLRQKIRKNLSTAQPERSFFGWMGLSWAALAAAILVLALASWRLLPRWHGTQEFEAAAVIDAHLRSLQAGHLVDVTSTDQHTVKPWFDGKIDFAPPVRNFAEEGFPLQGGRLDVLRGRTVAALVYGRRKHFINVFIWPTTEQDRAPRAGSHLGYQWLDWRKGGMEFCAVSDTSPVDLQELERLISE